MPVSHKSPLYMRQGAAAGKKWAEKYPMQIFPVGKTPPGKIDSVNVFNIIGGTISWAELSSRKKYPRKISLGGSIPKAKYTIIYFEKLK